MKESKTLEYKAEITNTFLKTVSAYANYNSGSIIFGIDDNGRAVSIDNPEQACLNIENRINDSIVPKPDFTFSVNPKTGVITLNVKKGRYTPYLYKGKAYRRSDTATVEADQIELQRLILGGQYMYFEQLPCDMDELCFNELSNAMRGRLAVTELTVDMLRTLGFFTSDRKYNNAAALFADNNRFFGTDIVRFGKSINEIMDRNTASHISILKQYAEANEMFGKYYQYEKIEGMSRKTVSLIPEEAYREAIANALAHRTWDVDAHIRVSMFADRIEITSPGGLPSGLSENEYLNGCISVMRNPVIGNVFFRLGMIEMFGTGIRRIKDSYESLDCSPQFAINDNSITVTLPVIGASAKVTSEEQLVLNALSSGLLMASSEIVEHTGLPKSKVIRLLNSLSEKQLISVQGNGRGTRYARR